MSRDERLTRTLRMFYSERNDSFLKNKKLAIAAIATIRAGRLASAM